MLKQNPQYSIVGPVWNEEGNLYKFYERLKETMDSSNEPWELILVNDGSTDRSWEIMQTLQGQDPRVKVIDFAKNFGHQLAVTAGLDHASGQAVIIIDTDLQDPPSVILKLIDKWKEGYEVVYAVRAERKGETWFKKMTASLFYRLIQRVTEVNIPLDAGDFRLIDRKVVDTVNTMRERHRFLRGLTSWVGFRQIGVEYVREERFAGRTGYPFNRMLKLAITAITGFSFFPLQIATIAGFIIAGLSAAGAIVVIYARLFLASQAFLGQATTLVAVLFLGGVQLITLGIIGEYLGRIYDEVRGRPLYIINQAQGFDETEQIERERQAA
jgi:glycosyltransferase involved in cell wall biosynthesis